MLTLSNINYLDIVDNYREFHKYMRTEGFFADDKIRSHKIKFVAYQL